MVSASLGKGREEEEKDTEKSSLFSDFQEEEEVLLHGDR